MAEKGTCHVDLAATVNVGNFQSIKATVSFSEDYYYATTTEDDENLFDLEESRNEKFHELLEVVNDKLDEVILAGVKKIKQLNRKNED